MKPRQASVELIYEGKNITEDIAPDLLSFTYTDKASGEADDISLELKDETGKWISNWAPKKGELLKAKIVATNWSGEAEKGILSCGTFLIDEVSYSGRPCRVSIGAISTPANTSFMSKGKNSTWKKATVQKIAQSIANNHQLKLKFAGKINPTLDFVEKSEESDAAFLFELCKKNGLAMKFYEGQIVIFHEAEYETLNSCASLTESLLTGWSAKTSFTDTGYDGCKVSYTHPTTGKLIDYTFKAPRKTGNKIYQHNEAVDNLDIARRVAQSKLRELNKNEHVLTLRLPGSIKLVASQMVDIDGLGVFAGKYYIDTARHNLGNGFTTELELHKALEGY